MRVVVIDRDRIIRRRLMQLIEELGPTWAAVARDSVAEARRAGNGALAGSIVLVDLETDEGAAARRELAASCRVLEVPVRRSASGVRRLARGSKLTALVATLRQQT
jgi:DNA-binding NarL/FixJ family response regulator